MGREAPPLLIYEPCSLDNRFTRDAARWSLSIIRRAAIRVYRNKKSLVTAERADQDFQLLLMQRAAIRPSQPKKTTGSRRESLLGLPTSSLKKSSCQTTSRQTRTCALRRQTNFHFMQYRHLCQVNTLSRLDNSRTKILPWITFRLSPLSTPHDDNGSVYAVE